MFEIKKEKFTVSRKEDIDSKIETLDDGVYEFTVEDQRRYEGNMIKNKKYIIVIENKRIAVLLELWDKFEGREPANKSELDAFIKEFKLVSKCGPNSQNRACASDKYVGAGPLNKLYRTLKEEYGITVSTTYNLRAGEPTFEDHVYAILLYDGKIKQDLLNRAGEYVKDNKVLQLFDDISDMVFRMPDDEIYYPANTLMEYLEEKYGIPGAISFDYPYSNNTGGYSPEQLAVYVLLALEDVLKKLINEMDDSAYQVTCFDF